jgi:hypothetical protein
MDTNQLFTYLCKAVDEANSNQFKDCTLCKLHWLKEVYFYGGIPEIPCLFSVIEEDLRNNISKYVYLVQDGVYSGWTIRATYHWVLAYVGILILPYRQMEFELVAPF